MADAVVVLGAEAGPVLAVVVEVQLGRDPGKRWTWPVYITTLRARLRCPTVLLVVCVDEATAAWCSVPIELGHPGARVVPLVLPEAARSYLEALMASGTYEYQSDFARRYFFQGRSEGEAKAILAVLDARGIAVDDATRARIAECSDLEQLDVWVRRAVTVTSAQELFG